MPKQEKQAEELVPKQAEQEIIVGNPEEFRPKVLPFIIQLPADASKAQIEFAKVLNAYAYKNPAKWAEKKDDRVVNGKTIKGLITQLKEKKFAPDPVEDPNVRLTYGNKAMPNSLGDNA